MVLALNCWPVLTLKSNLYRMQVEKNLFVHDQHKPNLEVGENLESCYVFGVICNQFTSIQHLGVDLLCLVIKLSRIYDYSFLVMAGTQPLQVLGP